MSSPRCCFKILRTEFSSTSCTWNLRKAPQKNLQNGVFPTISFTSLSKAAVLTLSGKKMEIVLILFFDVYFFVVLALALVLWYVFDVSAFLRQSGVLKRSGRSFKWAKMEGSPKEESSAAGAVLGVFGCFFSLVFGRFRWFFWFSKC